MSRGWLLTCCLSGALLGAETALMRAERLHTLALADYAQAEIADGLGDRKTAEQYLRQVQRTQSEADQAWQAVTHDPRVTAKRSELAKLGHSCCGRVGLFAQYGIEVITHGAAVRD